MPPYREDVDAIIENYQREKAELMDCIKKLQGPSRWERICNRWEKASSGTKMLIFTVPVCLILAAILPCLTCAATVIGTGKFEVYEKTIVSNILLPQAVQFGCQEACVREIGLRSDDDEDSVVAAWAEDIEPVKGFASCHCKYVMGEAVGPNIPITNAHYITRVEVRHLLRRNSK